MAANIARAQVSYGSEGKRTSIYLSVGTATQTYNPSTINITQGNVSSFDLEKVKGDNKVAPVSGGLNTNLRVGIIFDHEQRMGLELNYDPASYHVVDGQKVHLKGTLDNTVKDTTFAFTKKNGYSYYLNGANFLMLNFVYRQQLLRSKTNNLRLDLLGKAGIGPVMPHVYNTINGKDAEYPSFQLGGWNAGVEASLRLTIMRHVYLEVSPKYSYASYTDIGVYNGTATQKLTTFQWIFNIGYWFSVTKHNQLFEKRKIEKPALSIKPIHTEQPMEDAVD